MTVQPLFTTPAAEICKALELLPNVLETVRPLTRAQQRSLPEDIFRLSRLLTTERRELAQPYWSSPALVSAYCYYFWPWNLVRLAHLLPNLPLPSMPALSEGASAWLVDMGSGPLTLPVALWLARPELRRAGIRVFAQDAARQPLALGQRLFAALAEAMGQSAWHSVIQQGPLDGGARAAVQRMGGDDRLWLLAAANVLNEYCQGRKAGRRGHGMLEDDGGDDAPSVLEARLEGLLEQLGMVVRRNEGAALLCVEPGTRLGGKIVMLARRLLFAQGLQALSPCTHNGNCPLEGGRSWCHFTFAAQAAPKWLVELSAKVGLGKDALSLAPLLVSKGESANADRNDSCDARIVSTPFAVPGLRGRARYACSDKGLVLLEDVASIPSGGVRHISIPADVRRDGKSGALIVPAEGRSATNGRAPAATTHARPEQRTRPAARNTGRKPDRSRKGPRKP